MRKKIAILFMFSILAVPIYFAGVYGTLFEVNMCYSDVLQEITKNTERIVHEGKAEDLIQFSILIKSLPIQGYESDCKEIYVELISKLKASNLVNKDN